MRYCTFLKITVDVHRFKGFGLCSIPMVDDATVDKAIVAAVDVAVELAIELALELAIEIAQALIDAPHKS